jgi:hypothetical protein
MNNVTVSFERDQYDPIDIMQAVVNQVNTNLSILDASTANTVDLYTGTIGGIKDASGTNGDVAFSDSASKLYIKIGGKWVSLDASIHAFG